MIAIQRHRPPCRDTFIEDPDHPKALIAQRRHARDAQVKKLFFGLTPLAVKYHAGLLERRGHAIAHVLKIVALNDSDAERFHVELFNLRVALMAWQGLR